jgi:hypothetical protein
MKLRRSNRFNDAYLVLTPENRQRVDKALRVLAQDWRHPSLQVKKVRGMEGIWEARASLVLRITFELTGDLIILRNVGPHDDALKAA